MGEREKIIERETGERERDWEIGRKKENIIKREKETGLGEREKIIERLTGERERDWERGLGEREKIIERERERIGSKRENNRKRDRGEIG